MELVDRTYRIQRDLAEIAPIRDDLLAEPLEKELAAALATHREAVAARFNEGDLVKIARPSRYLPAGAPEDGPQPSQDTRSGSSTSWERPDR